MEDLRLKLKFNDINTRSRCLQKLAIAVQRKTKGSIITSSSIQIPELCLILEACADESPVTCKIAAETFLALSTNNYIDIDYAISKLISCMKSPGNYMQMLKTLTVLLLSKNNQIEESHAQRCLKYTLLFPKHPLIAALEEKEDSFPFVVECIIESLITNYEIAYFVMEPAMFYILCDPVHKVGKNSFKILLIEAILNKKENSLQSLLYVLKYFPFMQLESLSEVIEILHFLRKIYQHLTNVDLCSGNNVFLPESLLLISFSFLERSISFGHDASQLIEQFIPFIVKLNEKSGTSVNVCLILISQMIKSTSGSLLLKLALVASDLLDLVEISPTVAAILSLSILHLLPEPSIMSSCDTLKVSLSKLLGKLEVLFLENKNSVNDVNNSIENCWNVCDYTNYEYESFNLFEAFTSITLLAKSCVQFSKILDYSSRNFKINWIKKVKLYVDFAKKENFEMLYTLVMAQFLMSSDCEIFIQSCLEAIESILVKNPYLSTRIFSVLLYKLSIIECPKVKLQIVNFLPKSAVHKYSIPPVLGILQMMAKENELKSHAVYLMLQLWKKQDRCFSYLQKLLSESDKTFSFESGVNEILISQASAIHEICCTEPEKYGKEFLKTLSSIFNKSHDENSLSVACLAIDGIIALCRSEIIDIRSTWKALSPRLGREKRSLVAARLYQLLALVPDLKVKSFEYDKFMREIVSLIWKQLSNFNNPPIVISETYKTLSKFPMDCHVLKELPTAAKVNLKLPPSMTATPFEMGKSPEDVLSYIPGYCFIDLLKSYEDGDSLKGYTEFLQALVKIEVSELPRSVYSQKHISKKKKISEALSKVPEFLCTQIQARKSPALQKNLAVGVLFSYEPPLEVGKDGMPLKRSIAAQSRTYEQVLSVLLSEVNIDTNEWHRCILISSAWASFMERAFFACEEARRAELELQAAHGHINLTPEEMNIQSKSAWLWVRERLINVVRPVVKSTSTAHANAVFAIAGLVSALEKFYNGMDEESKIVSDKNEKYTCHQSFVAEYTETVVCAMHPDYQPTGNVQSWLLTHLSRPNSSASYLVTGCASSSLCHLAPILKNHYPDEIPRILQILLSNITHSSPVLSFYSSLGIGLFIKSLCEIGYLDNGSNQVNLLLDTVKKMVKIFEDSEGTLTNCLTALTLSMTSLSQASDENIKDWVSTTCNIFYEKLMDEEKSSMQFEVLCICVTALIISAVEGSCLTIQSIEDLSSWLDMNRLELPQCSGISVSLGMVIEAFERFGHSEGAELKQKVLKSWFNTATSEQKPTLQRIAALNGLCSLFSCGRGLVKVKCPPAAESSSALNDLIPFMFRTLNAPRDTGLQSICSWEVGRLFAVNCNQQQVESSASSSYSYLGEKSILKPLMNVIISYHSEGENAVKYCHTLACLNALAAPFPRPLPPINWTSILTPFLQQNNDNDSVEAALKIAIYQSSGSSHAANVLASYCNPPLIHTLSESCLKILVDNISGIVPTLATSKLQVFLQTAISLTIKKDDALLKLGDTVLKEVLKCLKQTGYKDQIKKILHDAFLSIFHYFKTKDYVNKFLPWISKALLHLPQDKFDSLLSVSQNNEDVALVTMIWCYLIKTGNKPLSSLKMCIDGGKCSSSEQKEQMCCHIYNCFLTGCHNEKSELSQVNKCISWLLETIGWIKVLEDSTSKYQLLTTGEVYAFLMDVCFATIIGCSGLENSYICLSKKSLSHKFLLEIFSQAICTISKKEEWCIIIDKIIDWLLMMLKSEYLKADEKYYIKLALCSLRNTSHFSKKEVWTEVLCNIYFSE